MVTESQSVGRPRPITPLSPSLVGEYAVINLLNKYPSLTAPHISHTRLPAGGNVQQFRPAPNKRTNDAQRIHHQWPVVDGGLSQCLSICRSARVHSLTQAVTKRS